MKRVSGLFEKILEPDLLNKAAKTACRHRKDRNEVASFMQGKEEKLSALRSSLIEGTFVPSVYRTRIKNERGKDRLIADISLYPDRILHTAVCLAAEEHIDRRLISQCYGGRKGKGQHMAVTHLCRSLRRNPDLKYALSIDIRQFYASIDKDILKGKLRRVYKDSRFLGLMDMLIDSYDLPGLPLGSRFSSMLANLYLSHLDHTLKERYHVHHMARFMDDIVVLGKSKQWLRRILEVIRKELEAVRLEIKSNWQIFPIASRGIPYLGYVIHPDHVLLRKSTKLRMKKAARRVLYEMQASG